MSEKIYDELKLYLRSQGFLDEFHTEVYKFYQIETDFLALKPTEKNRFIRKYIFELKEKNFDKVVKQASDRRDFCDYIYIVMVNTNFSYFTRKLGQYHDELRGKGIGVLYFNKDLMKDNNFFKVMYPNLQNKARKESVKRVIHNKWAELFSSLEKKLPKPQHQLG